MKCYKKLRKTRGLALASRILRSGRKRGWRRGNRVPFTHISTNHIRAAKSLCIISCRCSETCVGGDFGEMGRIQREMGEPGGERWGWASGSKERHCSGPVAPTLPWHLCLVCLSCCAPLSHLSLRSFPLGTPNSTTSHTRTACLFVHSAAIPPLKEMSPVSFLQSLLFWILRTTGMVKASWAPAF